MKYWRWGKITFTPRAPVKMSWCCQPWAPDWKDRCCLSSWWPFTSPFSTPFHLEALFFLLVLGKNLLLISFLNLIQWVSTLFFSVIPTMFYCPVLFLPSLLWSCTDCNLFYHPYQKPFEKLKWWIQILFMYLNQKTVEN